MRMRAFEITIAVAAGLLLASCNRQDTTHRDSPAARQVGREAYRASEDIKRGAKEAAQELKKAGKEVRQGWNEAKREESSRPKK
jgi:hypothetical protein